MTFALAGIAFAFWDGAPPRRALLTGAGAVARVPGKKARVTAPSDADDTRAAYFAKTPDV